MESIVEKFLQAQNRLVFQSSDLSLDAIANMVKGEAIDIKPKYQRRERWSKDKQSALIESFLLNIPVPPIYLAEDEYGRYSVIDGKQRVTSIYNFILQKERLVNLEKFKENIIIVRILDGMDYGKYTVKWKTVNSKGKEARGNYQFTIAE